VNFSPKIPVQKSNKKREYSRPKIKAALLEKNATGEELADIFGLDVAL
jgi:hypothetical protein